MDPHIEDFLEEVKASKQHSTFECRQSDLRQFNAYLEERGLAVDEVEPKDVHKFLRAEGEDHADSTVKGRYSSVKLLYDYLSGPLNDVYEESPVEDLERKDYSGNGKSKHTETDIVYLTPEEIDLLCENVGPNHALRDELAIRLAFHTGVRVGELVQIEVDSIDRETRSVKIWGEKTNDWRTVYYQPALDALLTEWLDGGYRAALHQSEYLFPSPHSERITKDRLNVRIRKAAERAGLQEVMYEDAAGNKRYKVTAHALRHSHAVQALQSGVDVRRVQQHLGHEKIETTMKYLRFVEKDVREAYQRFRPGPDDAEA